MEVPNFKVRHPRRLEPELQNGKKYSQNTAIFISYEWVDQIAVYNYMFRPLSAKYLAFPNETPCALYRSASKHSIFGHD